MSDRGMNHFIRAIVLFGRSLRPSFYKAKTHKGFHVGTDHLGNRYFEVPAMPEHGQRNPRRWFLPVGDAMSNFDQKLPPEWNAWLRLQRPDPPSEEEMAYKLDRIERIVAARPPKKETVTPSTGGSFPKFSEYENTPGTKYQEGCMEKDPEK